MRHKPRRDARRRPFFSLLLALAVVLVAAGCSSDTSEGSTNFPFVAGDGTVLRGRIYGRGAIAVILVHDFDGDQKRWAGFAQTLASRGYMVMTYDMRGHGDSPGTKEVGIADADVAAAMRYLRSSAERQQVLLVGEGVGGTAALKAAAKEQVLGVASLSAPPSFRGLSVLADIPRITGAKIFAAAENDKAGADAARSFKERASEKAELYLVPGDKRGVKLLEGSEGQPARAKLIDFLDANRPK